MWFEYGDDEKSVGEEVVKEVDKSRDIGDISKVDVSTYMEDKRRYGFDLVEDTKGLPQEFFELDIVSVYQVLNFLDVNMVNDRTNKRTYNNIVESYIMSGAFADEYLDKVFWIEAEPMINYHGEKIGEKNIYHRDEKEYRRIEVMAMQNWNLKQLASFVNGMFIDKLGGIKADDIIRMDVLNNALYNEDPDKRVQYMRMSIDVYGLKNRKEVVIQNIWEKGGREMVDAISENADLDFLK